jgi:uncharacterized membrane protein (UPF0127 family)
MEQEAATAREKDLKKLVSIVNQTTSAVVCQQAGVADTFASRLIGLLGKRGLPCGGGLLIQPSTGVHTWGMSFAIDIVTLDAQRRVVGLWSNVGPWRMRGLSARTRSVLELPAGQIALTRIAIGDRLALVDSAAPKQQAPARERQTALRETATAYAALR